MKPIFFLLAAALACLIANNVWSAAKPVTLVVEQTTTLHVGETAVLHIPTNMDNRFLRSGPNGAWRDVLAMVKRSGRDVTLRGVRPGKGVIIMSPNVPAGGCVSCVTIHYFIEVIPGK